jgi:transposase
MKKTILVLTLLAQNIVLAGSSLQILESEIVSKKAISPTETIFRSKIVAKVLSQQYNTELSKEHYKNIVNSENVNYVYSRSYKSQNNFSDLLEEQFIILEPNVL